MADMPNTVPADATAENKRGAITVLKPLAGIFVAYAMIMSATGVAYADGELTLELNKVEPAGTGCRVFMVFGNKTSVAIGSFKPDLVFFDKTGVIADRVVVEGGPLPAGKTRVKLFDVTGLGCDTIQHILLNDIRACSGQAPAACLAMSKTSSLGRIEFIK